jgi:hypothetical protein
MSRRALQARVFALAALLAAACARTPPDPLPSWQDTAPKRALLAFVADVTTPGSPGFVAAAERIAVFDNDGTLWAEQPIYFQASFIAYRVRQLAPQHPEWREQEPFASVLKGDLQAAMAGGERAILELAMATHADTTSEEFSRIAADWIDGARHPQTGRRFTEMAYQPMLELLEFLRARGFKTFIVSGGGVEFIRTWSERVYGIPPEQVVGSSIRTKYELRGGKPVLLRLPELNFIDDQAGKPVGIHQQIGRRPILAFGNSDGDFEMLEWTTAGEGPRLGLLLHHTDAEREWAYDRDSHVGRLARGLDEGPGRGWIIVDMALDWRAVFPGEGR